MTDRPPVSGEPSTLLLTFALPDFHADDLPESAQFYDGDLTAAFYEEGALISSTARLLIMSGDKGGTDLHSMRAVLVKADVVDRVPEHDEPEDERLTDAILRRASTGADAPPPLDAHRLGGLIERAIRESRRKNGLLPDGWTLVEMALAYPADTPTEPSARLRAEQQEGEGR